MKQHNLPHAVSTTHFLLANCTASEISVPDTDHNPWHQDSSKGQCKLQCHFPIAAIPGSLSPAATGVCQVTALQEWQLPFTLLQHLVCEGKLSDLPGCAKTLSWGTGPILLPLETFLQGQGHSVTES